MIGEELTTLTDNDYIAVDNGVTHLINQHIKPLFVIGDLDSLEDDKLLDNYDMKVYPSIKDDTDTLHALRMFAKYDKLIVLGGITGKRIDHFVANLKLLYEFENLVIIDENTMVMECRSGLELPKDEYKYYSFFALEDVANLTLSGFKYNLINHNLSHQSGLCVSNEIDSFGYVTYSSGRLLLIKTKE